MNYECTDGVPDEDETPDGYTDCRCGSCQFPYMNGSHYADKIMGLFMDSVVSYKNCLSYGYTKPINAPDKGIDGGYIISKISDKHMDILNRIPYVKYNMTNTHITRNNIDRIRGMHPDEFPISKNITDLTLNDFSRLFDYLGLELEKIGIMTTWPITAIYFMSGDNEIFTFTNPVTNDNYVFIVEHF